MACFGPNLCQRSGGKISVILDREENPLYVLLEGSLEHIINLITLSIRKRKWADWEAGPKDYETFCE